MDLRWRVETLNLSEASAIGVVADVMRLLDAREDPYVLRRVREGLLDQDSHEISPVQAAVLGKHANVLEILVDSSPSIDPVVWQQLHALAVQLQDQELISVIDRHFPGSL